MRSTRVYTPEGELLAQLPQAFDIGYSLKLNSLWTASFSLPADDPNNEYCEPLHLVDIFDGEQRVELFRIVSSELHRSGGTASIAYQCEHVLATLLDTVLFGFHEIGNIGVYTRDVLAYILARQARWVLGDCDFQRQFLYKWENENLLAALFSVANPIPEPYAWAWDTTKSPWVIHLKALPQETDCEIRYRKNLKEITRSMDARQLVTHLFALGYGEGDNQLTFASINDGKPYIGVAPLEETSHTYIDPASGQRKYSIESLWVDRRFEDKSALKARAEVLFNEYRKPYISYTAQAADIYRLTGDPFDRFLPGKTVRVVDDADGLQFIAPVVNVEKTNVTGAPGDIQITIANKTQDVAGSISELKDRLRINDVYAQGASNVFSKTFTDNADPEHPARFTFYLSSKMERINEVRLQFECEPFRSYSRGVDSVGAQSRSTDSGGGSYPTTETSPGSAQSTSSGGGTYNATNYDGAVTTTSASATTPVTTISAFNYPGPTWQDAMRDHQHYLRYEGHSHTVSTPSHSHQFSVPNHSHMVNIPSHSHKVTINAHSHTFLIPGHNHVMEFGIYEGTTATRITLRIDGTEVGSFGASDEFDIVQYLSKDGGGRIQRDSRHVVEMIPDKMTRIAADFFCQVFINSRGKGDF